VFLSFNGGLSDGLLNQVRLFLHQEGHDIISADADMQVSHRCQRLGLAHVVVVAMSPDYLESAHCRGDAIMIDYNSITVMPLIDEELFNVDVLATWIETAKELSDEDPAFAKAIGMICQQDPICVGRKGTGFEFFKHRFKEAVSVDLASLEWKYVARILIAGFATKHNCCS